MKNLLNSVKLNRPKRSTFDLTHDVKLTTDMGRLTPVMAMECVPGDKFSLGAESLVRFAPLISPVMHRMDITIHYFFVPNRILWQNWENFITGGVDGNDTSAPPVFSSDDPLDRSVSSLANYLGIPVNMAHGVNISALPFAAYQKIYDEYYRDQNLIPQLYPPGSYPLLDGNNGDRFDLWQLRTRAWKHDYFTASLPFAQKGSAVEIPLGSVNAQVYANDSLQYPGDTTMRFDGTTGQPSDRASVPSIPYGTPPFESPDSSLFASGDVEPTTINDLRRAFKLQEWLERNARAGSRYVENIMAHFGVRSKDSRLQRPEYITGVKSPVVISEVLNTTGASDAPVQGNMAGHGVGVVSGKSGSYFCEEHGWIMGIMSVMPEPAYQQGLHKKFQKFDRFDYFWPSFAHIGEQPVMNSEVYANSASPLETFGYIPRYAEYKFEQNRVAGAFQDTLNFWTLGRIFDSEPALNKDFVECDPGKRIFAVTESGVDSLYIQVLNKVVASRLMPKFGTPHL